MHLALAGGCLWRKLTSICEHKRAPVEHIILFFSRGTDRNARSMAQRRSVSFPFSGNHGYICNLRRSLPKGTSTLRPLGDAMGTLSPRRHAEGKVSKSWIPKSQTWGTPSLLSRLGSKENPSSGQLKARHHRLAHESMALGVEVSESDSLNWEETSTLDAMNS